MKELTHELGPAILVLCIPHVGKNEIISADEFQASVCCRFVDHDLRTSGVYDTAGHKRPIHVMEAHGARVGPAYATELQNIAFPLCHRYILEAFRRVTDDFEEGAGLALLVWCLFRLLCVERV